MNEVSRPWHASNYLNTPQDIHGFIVELLREPMSEIELRESLRIIRDTIERWERK